MSLAGGANKAMTTCHLGRMLYHTILIKHIRGRESRKGSGVLGVKFTLLQRCALLFSCDTHPAPTGGVFVLIDYRLSGVATRRITQLLAYAVGDGSDLLQSMYSGAPAKLYVWIADDREAVGLIGWWAQGGSLEILHIAVDEKKRLALRSL